MRKLPWAARMRILSSIEVGAACAKPTARERMVINGEALMVVLSGS